MKKYIVPTLFIIDIESVLMISVSGDSSDSVPVYTDDSQNVEDALARPHYIWGDDSSNM